MELYFVNAGGSSKYDYYAKLANWKLGINSGGKSKPRERVFMVDNDWKNYNHERHLRICCSHRPEIATIKDIEVKEEISTILKLSLDLLLYAAKIMVIPKTYCALEIRQFLDEYQLWERYILGIPIGRYAHTCCFRTINEVSLPLHLLGGSPNRQALFAEHYGERVKSLDSNYTQRIAQYGKIVYQGYMGYPSKTLVPDGPDYNYRCFYHSILKQREYWLIPKPINQLSLFEP